MKAHLECVDSCDAIYENISTQDLLSMLYPKKSYKCDYCPKTYTDSSNRCRHQRTCSNSPTASSSVSQQITAQESSVVIAPINSTIGNVTVNNDLSTNINIRIENLGNENLGFLNGEYIIECMRNQEIGIRDLVNMIHFSGNCDQNRNIRLRNIKLHTVDIVRDQEWITVVDDEAYGIILKYVRDMYNNMYFINDEYGVRTKDNKGRIGEFIMNITTPQSYKKTKQYMLSLLITQKEKSIRLNLKT